jgi:hypothetical protein
VLTVSAKVPKSGRSRWLVLVVSLAASAGMLYAQHDQPGCCAQQPVDSAAPHHVEPTPTPQPTASAVTAAELLAASRPIDPHTFDLALPAGVASENGLQIHTIWAARAISVLFPDITTIYGYRQDPLKWHPNGLAIDVMIPNHNSKEGIELGNQIAGYALANAKRWGVLHVIWRQALYPGVGAPSWTANYGNETLNHFDHVHIATDGGGYPTGREVYYVGSMQS